MAQATLSCRYAAIPLVAPDKAAFAEHNVVVASSVSFASVKRDKSSLTPLLLLSNSKRRL